MSSKFIEDVSSGDGIYITNYAHTPYYSPDAAILNDGVVRTRHGGLEYYDAKIDAWMPLPGMTIRVSMDPASAYAVAWVQKKMVEEENLEKLLKNYPSLKQAKENYELIKALVQNENA